MASVSDLQRALANLKKQKDDEKKRKVKQRVDGPDPKAGRDCDDAWCCV